MSPQAKGANMRLIIQKETTPGQDPAVPDAQKVHYETCGLRLVRGNESSAVIQSDRNPTKPGRDVDDVAGPITTELQAYMDVLFEAALGSVTTTGAGPYVHTFKIGSSVPSLLIEKGFVDINQYYKYNLCKVSKLGMAVTPKGLQKITFDFMGAKETVSGASFDDTPTDLGKVSFDGRAIATIEEGGAAIATIVGIDNLSFENDLDGDQYAVGGGGIRDDIPEGMVKVTGTVKARFTDLTLYNKAINSTETSIRVVYQKGDGSGSAGNESLEMKLPELVYSPNSPVVNGPKGVLVELPFEAYYDDSAEATTLQVILKNTQATV